MRKRILPRSFLKAKRVSGQSCPKKQHQDHGFSFCLGHSLSDGLFPVRNTFVGTAGTCHVTADLPADILHLFRPRIVGGKIDPAAVFSGGQTQIFPAVQSFSAGAAKNSGYPVVRIFLLYRFKNFFKTQSVVGEVHDGPKISVPALKFFHPAVYRNPGQAGLHILRGKAEGAGHGNGGQSVLHVENAVHRQRKGLIKSAASDPELDLSLIRPQIVSVDIRSGGGAEGDDLFRRCGVLEDRAAEGGIQIDTGSLYLPEQQQL